MESKKYSIWIVPKGEVGERLQKLITDLAERFDAPAFVPHMTLVANIFAKDDELDAVRHNIADFVKRIKPLKITLTSYGYKDEEFRCLYLLAEGNGVVELYRTANEVFPQVAREHFAALPHISVLYGSHDEATKKEIIAENAITPLTFTLDSCDLYFTNNPVESWKLILSVKTEEY